MNWWLVGGLLVALVLLIALRAYIRRPPVPAPLLRRGMVVRMNGQERTIVHVDHYTIIVDRPF